MRIRQKTIMDQMNAERADDVLADIEAKHGCAAPPCSEADLRIALAESVKLQAHYAKLLNQWDGGERMIFKDSAAWIARLRETKTLPPNSR